MEHNPKSMAREGATNTGGDTGGGSDAPAKTGGGGSALPATKRAAGRASRVSSRRPVKAGHGSGSKPKAPERAEPKAAEPKPAATKAAKRINGVRAARIERMMSKAELARRAGLSVLTIDRVEKGLETRMDTKRKILEALGLRPEDRVRVFGEEE